MFIQACLCSWMVCVVWSSWMVCCMEFMDVCCMEFMDVCCMEFMDGVL